MSQDAAVAEALESWIGGDIGELRRGGLAWLDAERSSALERVRRQRVPSSRQELWRYTSLKSLVEQRFSSRPEPAARVAAGDLDAVLVPGLDAHRAVLVNGRFVPELSCLGDVPQGVRAGGLRAILENDADTLACYLNKLAGEGERLFSDLNTAGMDDGFALLVDPAVTVERPIEILHLSVGAAEPRVAQPRHLIVLGEDARATLIERYASLGEPTYCTNASLELVLEQGADLDHSRIQTESSNAFHLTTLYSSQAESSRYFGLNFGVGGAWSRTDLVMRFSGRQAECDLKGLYLAGDKQLVDYHLDVDHGIPQCTSREDFKGILYGKGRAVFDGRIHVARDAQKTDAHLSNKNLLLSRSAEVDTKPQLEIFADDVKCSHGATVGQIEPEALFYLRSRGLSELSARRMLCLGFAGEIIDALGSEPLRDYLTELVGKRLETAPLE